MQKMLNPFIVVLYFGALLYAAVMGYVKPFNNWDMLGYTGTVISWSESSNEAIYNKTMAAAHESVPDWVYKQYLKNPISAESEAFVQQLPLYKVKPLYTGGIWLFHQLGFDLLHASVLISSLSIMALSIIIFLWKPRYMSQNGWLISILGLSFLFPYAMGSLAQSSSPDALCTLLITGMFFSWLYLGSFPLFCVFAFLAQLARPDALLMSVAFAVYFALLVPGPKRMDKIKAGVLCVVLAISYMIISKLGGNYGLERWFIYAFIDKTPYPGEATDHLTLAKYWHTLAPSIILFVNRPRTIAMIVWTLFALLLYRFKPVEGNRQNMHIVLISWAVLTIRFMMFPGWGEDRYYFVYFVIIIYAGGEMMAPYISATIKAIRAAHAKIVNTDT